MGVLVTPRRKRLSDVTVLDSNSSQRCAREDILEFFSACGPFGTVQPDPKVDLKMLPSPTFFCPSSSETRTVYNVPSHLFH